MTDNSWEMFLIWFFLLSLAFQQRAQRQKAPSRCQVLLHLRGMQWEMEAQSASVPSTACRRKLRTVLENYLWTLHFLSHRATPGRSFNRKSSPLPNRTSCQVWSCYLKGSLKVCLGWAWNSGRLWGLPRKPGHPGVCLGKALWSRTGHLYAAITLLLIPTSVWK